MQSKKQVFALSFLVILIFRIRKCSANRRHTTPGLRMNLDCHGTRLQTRFLHITRLIGSEEDWYGHVLRRIGSEDGLDQAVQAVIKAYELADPVLLRGSTSYYRSLATLQSACKRNKISNGDLLVASLCFLYEIRATATGSFTHIHGNGIAAMLTSRPAKSWKGDIARTVFYLSSTLIFHNAVLQGKPSPFDDGEWIHVTPNFTNACSTSSLRIRHLAQVLLIRLPRLILLVRGYEGILEHTSDAHKTIYTEMDELLAVHDIEAYEKAVSPLALVKSQTPGVSKYYNKSYNFQSHSHFEALILWWTSRLILVRLYSKMNARALKDPVVSMAPPQPKEELETQQRHLCDHILRSMEYTSTLSPMSRWPYLLAIQPAFGALEELGTDQDKDGGAQVQSVLVDWYAWFLSDLHMPQQAPRVLMYLSNAINGGRL